MIKTVGLSPSKKDDPSLKKVFYSQAIKNNTKNKTHSISKSPMLKTNNLNFGLAFSNKGIFSQSPNSIRVTHNSKNQVKHQSYDFGISSTRNTNNSSNRSSSNSLKNPTEGSSRRTTSSDSYRNDLNSSFDKQRSYGKALFNKPPPRKVEGIESNPKLSVIKNNHRKQLSVKDMIEDVIKFENKFKLQSNTNNNEASGLDRMKTLVLDEPISSSKTPAKATPGSSSINIGNTFYNELIDLNYKYLKVTENYRLNLSNKHTAEILWNCNTFELSHHASTPKDLVLFEETEYLRQIYLMLLMELTGDQYLNNASVINCMKNMTFFIHRNLLIISDYILQSDSLKVEGESKTKLQKILLTSLKIKKGEHCSHLKHNNDSLISSIKSLTR